MQLYSSRSIHTVHSPTPCLPCCLCLVGAADSQEKIEKGTHQHQYTTVSAIVIKKSNK